MKQLPNHQNALIPKPKIVEYLLSEANSGGKSAFFVRFGFSEGDWIRLYDALLEHAKVSQLVKSEQSVFGTRYVVEGPLATPSGRLPWLRSVWFISKGEAVPRLVTAYPIRREVQ
ncbi:MAG: DUF6883 domain-containing protein [Litorilinea sp.]